jgi:hypothetical protein
VSRGGQRHEPGGGQRQGRGQRPLGLIPTLSGVTAPQFGYAVPPAYSLHNRIPDTEPFVVGPNRRNALLVSLLSPAVVAGVYLGFAAARAPRGESVFILLVPLVCLVPFISLTSGLRYYQLTAGGPRLAAGPAGLWVTVRLLPRRAAWLPWEGVEGVYLRRQLGQRLIYVKPRGARSGYGVFASTCDRPVHEILATLAGYSAGRAAIGEPR